MSGWLTNHRTVELHARNTQHDRDPAAGSFGSDAPQHTTGSTVDVVKLELDSLPSVRACAGAWLANHGPLNLLINNAGVMACPLARTEAGWELQFATKPNQSIASENDSLKKKYSKCQP